MPRVRKQYGQGVWVLFESQVRLLRIVSRPYHFPDNRKMVDAGTLTSPLTHMDKEMYVLRLMDMLDGAGHMTALERHIRAREYVTDLLDAYAETENAHGAQ